MSRRSWPWSVLAIDQTSDLKTIRRAYADKLKAMDIDRDAAAYANLRNARDVALDRARLAASSAAKEETEDEWSISAGLAEDYGASGDDDAILFDDTDLDDTGSEGFEPYERFESDGPPVEAPDYSGPDRDLSLLLFPNGERSEEGFTAEEFEAARSAMQAIVEDAQASELARQQMADFWLADRLATAWPRSAPLVAEAAEAFEWEKRDGQLGEGPAQAFLNARLRGMRFHEAVQQPGHWGYKAWKELSTPGKKGPLGWTRASKSDVRRLISGIRENFPELESLLDWEKVSDWTQPVDNPWPSFGTIFIVIVIAVQFLRFCGSAVDFVSADELSDAPPAAVWTAEDRDALATELFGPGVTYEAVTLGVPEFARALEQQEELQRASPDGFSILNNLMEGVIVGQVREMVLNSDRETDFDQLIRIKQLKLKLLDLAYSTRGVTFCASFSRGATFSGNIEVPPDVRKDERLLAAELLTDGKLEYPVNRPVRSATIPGELFAAAERESGVSGEAASRAAMGEGSDSDICLFRKALLAEALRRPGSLTRDLLLIL